jgi:hypothetical protein
MRLSAPTVRAEVPWGGTQGRPQVPHEGGAPRKTVTYECPDGHKFDRVFALAAEVPVTWDCPRCGRTARLEGAPEGTEGRPELPGYSSTSGGRAGVPQGDITPWGQLMKRRTRKQGAALLAEAMARARESGVAR